MGNPVTARLVRYDFPGPLAMTPNQSAEKPLGGPGIPAALKKHSDDIPVLVHGTPQVVLFTP